jgi:hypothetical protein
MLAGLIQAPARGIAASIAQVMAGLARVVAARIEKAGPESTGEAAAG